MTHLLLAKNYSNKRHCQLFILKAFFFFEFGEKRKIKTPFHSSQYSLKSFKINWFFAPALLFWCLQGCAAWGSLQGAGVLTGNVRMSQGFAGLPTQTLLLPPRAFPRDRKGNWELAQVGLQQSAPAAGAARAVAQERLPSFCPEQPQSCPRVPLGGLGGSRDRKGTCCSAGDMAGTPWGGPVPLGLC